MNEREVSITLGTLRFVDEQTARAYELAVSRVRDSGAQEKLRNFREDHLRHIGELEQASRQAARQMTEPAGHVREVFEVRHHTIDSAPDETSVFRELLSAEEIDALAYGLIAEMTAEPREIMAVVRRHHDDEWRHLQYLQQQVTARTPAPAR